MHPNQLPQYPKVFSKDELPHFTYLKAKHREVKQSVQDNKQGSAKNVKDYVFGLPVPRTTLFFSVTMSN